MPHKMTIDARVQRHVQDFSWHVTTGQTETDDLLNINVNHI